MKHGKAVKAYKAILRLSGQALTLRDAYALHGLKKALAGAWEFQLEQERAIIDRLGAEITADGNLEFRAVDEAEEYRAKMRELADMEAQDDVSPVKIKLQDGIRISVHDMEALEGLVKFEEE